jgi:hypothetical protein
MAFDPSANGSRVEPKEAANPDGGNVARGERIGELLRHVQVGRELINIPQ